jgi:hypothetical protein
MAMRYEDGKENYVYCCCIRACKFMHHDKDLSSPAAAVCLFVEPSIIITSSSPVLHHFIL